MGCIPQIILHLWGFLCVRDAGHTGNKITGKGYIEYFMETLRNGLFWFNICKATCKVCKVRVLKAASSYKRQEVWHETPTRLWFLIGCISFLAHEKTFFAIILIGFIIFFTCEKHWVIPEKIHTSMTEDLLENLTGGGVNSSGNSDVRGALNLKIHPRG